MQLYPQTICLYGLCLMNTEKLTNSTSAIPIKKQKHMVCLYLKAVHYGLYSCKREFQTKSKAWAASA